MPTVELDLDVVEKLEAARFSADESLSEVIRRAQLIEKPQTARDLLREFEQRAGQSPLSDEALDRLAEVQRNPAQGRSHWSID